MSRTCPDCDVSLAPRDFQGVTIDACPQCAGIFFDEGEVAQIKAKGLDAMEELEDAVTPTITVDASADRLRRCPTCAQGMDKFRYMYNSNIMLDQCERCGGIWVQDGELRRMSEVLAASGVQRTAAPRQVSVVWADSNRANEQPSPNRVKKVQDFIRTFGRRSQSQTA